MDAPEPFWGRHRMQEQPMLKTTNMLKAAAMCLAVLFGATPCSQEEQAGKATGIAAQILNGEKRNLEFGPYKWRVIQAKGGKALMITEDVIEKRAYHSVEEPVDWEACDLRKYLNGDFFQKFSADEQKLILETKNQNPNNPKFLTKGGADTTDKVFLLSIDEAKNNLYAKERKASHWWWLRSPGGGTGYIQGFELSKWAALVFDGNVSVFSLGSISALSLAKISAIGCPVHDPEGGVRPALWLNLKP
jgi:hypothetical protein